MFYRNKVRALVAPIRTGLDSVGQAVSGSPPYSYVAETATVTGDGKLYDCSIGHCASVKLGQGSKLVSCIIEAGIKLTVAPGATLIGCHFQSIQDYADVSIGENSLLYVSAFSCDTGIVIGRNAFIAGSKLAYGDIRIGDDSVVVMSFIGSNTAGKDTRFSAGNGLMLYSGALYMSEASGNRVAVGDRLTVPNVDVIFRTVDFQSLTMASALRTASSMHDIRNSNLTIVAFPRHGTYSIGNDALFLNGIAIALCRFPCLVGNSFKVAKSTGLNRPVVLSLKSFTAGSGVTVLPLDTNANNCWCPEMRIGRVGMGLELRSGSVVCLPETCNVSACSGYDTLITVDTGGVLKLRSYDD